MRWYPIEKPELIRADPEDLEEGCRHRVDATRDEACQQFVEGLRLAEHADGDFMGEAPIGIAE